jgi:hypothetical protein
MTLVIQQGPSPQTPTRPAADEGRVTTLDLAHAGKLVAAVDTGGKGVDIIAYNSSLAHLYVPAVATVRRWRFSVSELMEA